MGCADEGGRLLRFVSVHHFYGPRVSPCGFHHQMADIVQLQFCNVPLKARKFCFCDYTLGMRVRIDGPCFRSSPDFKVLQLCNLPNPLTAILAGDTLIRTRPNNAMHKRPKESVWPMSLQALSLNENPFEETCHVTK